MQIIKYEFIDGTTALVPVEDNFYSLYQRLLLLEKLNDRKETRRHISLNYLNENGIDFTNCDDDLSVFMVAYEQNIKIKNAI